MASLYELNKWYTNLLADYDAAETDEEREAILLMLAGAGDEITEKAEAYAKVIRMKEEEANGFKAEADRLTARRKAAENMVKRLKETLLYAMKITGTQEIKTSIGKWKLADNPWSCEVLDIDTVPQEYHIKVEDKIDKKALLDTFKATGEIIPGCSFKREQGIRFK